MIKVEEARAIVSEGVKTMSPEEISAKDAFGRILAVDVYAGDDIPFCDNSAMDGYAVRKSDIEGASKEDPKTLEVIEVIRAGYVGERVVEEGQAAKIMTGAPVPEGADSVVMVENTHQETPSEVKVVAPTKPGENIRKAGEDIKTGELVIGKGTVLGASHVGMLASLGRSKIKVIKKPRVAVLTTGDELISAGEELEPGKLYSSNNDTLCCQIREAGGIAEDLGTSKDDREELEKKIAEGLKYDMLITSGGVSMGDYDFVKEVLVKLGAEMKFEKIAVKPGKPVVFGVVKDVPVFGLPGNPVSSMVSFELFAKPVVWKMLARPDYDSLKEVTAVLEEDIKKKKGRRHFIRAKTSWEDGEYTVCTTGPQGSGILKSMILANSLIILPEEEESAKRGDKVRVIFL